jgi:hypothetical protein
MSFNVLYENSDFVVISKLKYSRQEQLEILRNAINEAIQIMEIDVEDPITSSTLSQDSIKEMLDNAMETNEYGIVKCQHCNKMLTYGYDDDDMVHCQKCHNVWDGYAQCDCY